MPLYLSVNEEGWSWDPEYIESYNRIAPNYLVNKFKDFQGDDCRLFCSQSEIKLLLKSILPPVSKDELDQEVKKVLAGMEDMESIEVVEFLSAAMDNTYWKKAGPLVVMELIFLDCLNAYYFEKRNMLDNDDYNELKAELTWEGSATATMTEKEAHFISAVAAYRRGQSLMNDHEYQKLKDDLLSESSWVVRKEQDPLEKLGLDTFMGYLHRSL